MQTPYGLIEESPTPASDECGKRKSPPSYRFQHKYSTLSRPWTLKCPAPHPFGFGVQISLAFEKILDKITDC
jgi:hypothetical protein